jgi:hypothetical protein
MEQFWQFNYLPSAGADCPHLAQSPSISTVARADEKPPRRAAAAIAASTA